MPVEIIVEPIAALAAPFAQHFAAAAQAAIAARGSFACAVPGGSVATQLLPALRPVQVAWDRVEIFWVDERAVPAMDPDSNYAVARRVWLDHVPIRPTHLHRMPADQVDRIAAAEEYEADLVETLGDPPRLDLVLLGVGPDGHVASLFPGQATLAARAWVTVVEESPKPPLHRLTLTLATIEQARCIWIAAFGSEKAEAVRVAHHEAKSKLPVALVARAGPPVVWWLDPQAAGAVGSA